MAKIWRTLAVLLAAFWLTPAQADGVEDARPSVVRVIAAVDGPYGFEAGTGTGFAISPTRIVTNAHVVERVYNASGRSGILIIPSNTRRKVNARIIAYDRSRDLAVLEVEGATFTPLKLYGGSVPQGIQVVGLGFPGNVDDLTDASVVDPQTAVRSDGTFSHFSKAREMNVLIHDAKIAHGHSGGPLLDRCGRILGVNTLVTSNEAGDSSYGFSISIAELRDFLKRNELKTQSVDSECVPPEVAEARKIAATAKADQDKALAAMDARAAKDRQRQQHIAVLQDERDNRMALAALLLVMAALAGAYALIAGNKQDPENPKPWPARIGWSGAALLVLGAVTAFLTRPSLSEPMPYVVPPTVESEAAAASPAAEGAMVASDDEAMKK